MTPEQKQALEAKLQAALNSVLWEIFDGADIGTAERMASLSAEHAESLANVAASEAGTILKVRP